MSDRRTELYLPIPAWTIINLEVEIDGLFANRELPDGKPVFLIFTKQELAVRFAEEDGRYGDDAAEVPDIERLIEMMEFLLRKGVIYVALDPKPRAIGDIAGLRPIERVLSAYYAHRTGQGDAEDSR